MLIRRHPCVNHYGFLFDLCASFDCGTCTAAFVQCSATSEHPDSRAEASPNGRSKHPCSSAPAANKSRLIAQSAQQTQKATGKLGFSSVQSVLLVPTPPRRACAFLELLGAYCPLCPVCTCAQPSLHACGLLQLHGGVSSLSILLLCTRQC